MKKSMEVKQLLSELAKSKLFLILFLSFYSQGIWAGEIVPQLNADIIIFKDLEGYIYAQIGSLKANRDTGLTIGGILATTKEGLIDSQVIQKALDSLKPVGPEYEGQKAAGVILIKKGVYNIGQEGLKLPYPSQLVIEGEGWDTNLPESWKKLTKNSFSLGGTYLIYEGKEVAISYKEMKGVAGYFCLEMNNLTVVLKNECEAGIRVPLISQKYLNGISVIALKPAKWGIHLDGAGGNTGYFKNIFLIGPFETALDMDTDWAVAVNIHAKGYINCGIKSIFTTTIIGGLIEAETQ